MFKSTDLGTFLFFVLIVIILREVARLHFLHQL